MTDLENDPPDNSPGPEPDDLFVAAARAPEPVPQEPSAKPSVDGAGDDGSGQTDVVIDHTGAESWTGEGTQSVPASEPQYQPPSQGSFGYHVPPPSGPDGQGGHRAGEYPAGPPIASQPQFGRRAPQGPRRADADGFYPSDYYLGVDWMRVVLGGLMATVLIVALVGTGLYLFDRFDPRDDDDDVEVVEATLIPEVDVYACAGDPSPVSSMAPPASFLISGRDAGNRWLAFRNPQSGRRQLWIRSSAIPTFDPSTVGVVSCATVDTEFPTPLSGATPSSGANAAPTSAAGGGPTPTPVPTPTPTG